MSWYEKQWKVVKLKHVEPTYARSGGGTLSYMNNMGWYNKMLLNSGKRNRIIQQYNLMDSTVDINRALDIMAEDISSKGVDDDEVFLLDFPEETTVDNSKLKTVNSALNLWEKKTEFDYKFFDYIREMLKYGSIIFKREAGGKLTKLIPERIEGYKISATDDSEVTHYIYNTSISYKNANGDVITGIGTGNKNAAEIIDVKKLLILKIGDGPFGESILARVYRIWKQLQLLEDAIIIYRIVRAPERRAFFIDIGKMPAHKAEAYIERIKNKMYQKQVIKDGEINTEYNPASMQEDFFIGQTGDGRGSKIETLPGGDNVGKIADVIYFNKKLALGLRIPPSYLERLGSDDNNGPTMNDGRVGTAYMAELRYVGFIKRMQQTLSKSLFVHFKRFAKANGVEFNESLQELKFSISPPQSFAIYKENELYSTLFNTLSSSEAFSSISKRYALEKYMNWDKDEVAANEELVLLEKGVPKGTKLDENVRANLIYGDGTALEDQASAEQDSADIDAGLSITDDALPSKENEELPSEES